jgi:protein involved in polysaccharide export with SLBB domain
MNNLFNRKSVLIDCIAMLLIVFFVTQNVFAASVSRYGSVKRSSTVMNPGGTAGEGEKGVTSLGGGQRQRQPKQMGMDPSQAGQLFQMIKVHVVGDVEAPGVYTTALSSRAADIIQQAVPNRDAARLFTIKNDKTGNVKTYDLYSYFFYGSLKNNPYVQDGDVIRVPKARSTIKIEGPVSRPGEFELSYEKSLKQVIHLAGETTSSNAKNYPIKVIRFNKVGQKEIISVKQKNKELKKFKIQTGDVIIVPDLINAKKMFDYSLETIPGENIVYPTSVPEVFVIGAVLNPGPYPYKAHLTVKDYLGYSGAAENAHLRSVKILRGGKKNRRQLYAQVDAGDVIIVREKNVDVFVKYVSVFATIISVATSAIVLKSYIDRQ